MKLTEFSGKKGKVTEGKMSELDLDLKDKKMSDKEFKAKYKKTKAEAKAAVKPKKVKEATLTELSKDTLSSYVKKSDKDADKKMWAGDKKAKAGDTAGAMKDFDKVDKRNAGAIKARERLPNMGVKEATGDASFDGMMNNITNNTEPSAQLGNKQTTPDRKIMQLTHQIFMKLRDYDDPEIYQKFINFMIKTVSDNVGPLDESRKR